MTDQDQRHLDVPDETHVEERQLLRRANKIRQVPAHAKRIRYRPRQCFDLRNEEREVTCNM